ncbi:MAG: glycosyltransferase [Deltaproteobacteria bacterium]|jgi:glycosyltransferase involved in cell wall biosynthesis
MAARLRIAIAIPNFERLGAQRVAFWVAQGLDRSRFEPFFLVHEATGELASQAPYDVPVVEVDRYLPRLRRGRSIARLRGYARALREHVPDVALGVVQYPSLALLAARAQLRAGWSVVACEHSFVTKNLEDAEAYAPAFRRIYAATLRPAYNHAVDRVLMTAEEGRDDLVSNFGVDASRIVVVPNPIDLPRVRASAEEPLEDPWLPREPGRDAEVPVIVGAGRFVAQKRFDHLVRAFAVTRRARRARLILSGSGPGRAELETLARTLGIAEDVRFVESSPPWRHMRRAALFALSSEWEGFPMVLAEAMALACPIVSYACPSGPREMLEDGRGGVLVPSGDVDALGAAMAEALAEPSRMRTLGAHAAQRAEAYSIPRVVSRYEEIFEELTREHR